ncbi:hypothetical protein ACFYZ9_35360 [Streptomyces sp. NPDC001691]|uniref:hypothetical protein n=1 Tax=Streptomyces sp. NPDC001691 TaxID=3364600 RepID=UPI0036C8B5BD
MPGTYLIDQPCTMGDNGREHHSGAPTDMVEAGQELLVFLQAHLSDPTSETKTDLFYAREKLVLAMTGWAHWEENGRQLLDEVLDAAGAIEYQRATTLDAVKASLDKLICLP